MESSSGTKNNQSDVDSIASAAQQDANVIKSWMELRSYIRQLHRTTIKTSQANRNTGSHSITTSDSHIKELSEMLVDHDAHQLFVRVHQLSYEFCIELKVRLLTTCKDSPTLQDARHFIQSVCECYQWVMNVCEAVQEAFKKLDNVHLSRFGLNWTTVNMHTYHSTLFTDHDVQLYLGVCTLLVREEASANLYSEKVGTMVSATDALGCITSLKRTLSVAEDIWASAERHLEDYSLPRSSITPHNRIATNWSQGTSNCKHLGVKTGSSCAKTLSAGETTAETCPCRECTAMVDSGMAMSAMAGSLAPPGEQASQALHCACQFCYSSSNGTQVVSNISNSEGNVLPPLTQPQLSLYPHIHGNSAELISTESLSRYNAYVPAPAAPKPPVFNNQYLFRQQGSDMLTARLIHEWDRSYGDTLSPPGSHPLGSSKQDGLVNGLESLSLTADLASSGQSFTPLLAANFQATQSVLASSFDVQSVANNSSCAGVITHTNTLAPNTCKAPHHSVPEARQASFEDLSQSRDSTSGGDSSGHDADPWTSSDDSVVYSSDEAPHSTLTAVTPHNYKLHSLKSHNDHRRCCQPQSENSDDDDGTLAELRRRAPDVTITVVKPGQRSDSRNSDQPQVSISRGNLKSDSYQPSLSYSKRDSSVAASKSWMPPTDKMPFTQGGFSMHGIGQVGATNTSAKEGEPTLKSGTLGNILKNLDSSSKKADVEKDSSGSQMVTIRRIVDPVSSEPTVTITLKGQEPQEDKVLFKLVNGQASDKEPEQFARGVPIKIPEGLSKSQIRSYKNKMKKQKREHLKRDEKRQAEEAQAREQLQLDKQQHFLKQEELKIRKQQAALRRQQEELSTRHQNNTNKPEVPKPLPPSTKGKKNNNKKKDTLDMTHNFNLPPGVSINKVAGQPGIVTISNNMGNSFGQSFFGNPNLPRPTSVPAAPSRTATSKPPVQVSNEKRKAKVEPKSKKPTKKESVVVVETKPKTKTKPQPKVVDEWFESLTSEEKIERALAGEVDVALLNQTQTKKYKKQLKINLAEAEAIREQQQVDDELMEQTYNLLIGNKNKKSKNQKSAAKNPSNKAPDHKNATKTPTSKNNNESKKSKPQNTDKSNGTTSQKKSQPLVTKLDKSEAAKKKPQVSKLTPTSAASKPSKDQVKTTPIQAKQKPNQQNVKKSVTVKQEESVTVSQKKAKKLQPPDQNTMKCTNVPEKPTKKESQPNPVKSKTKQINKTEPKLNGKKDHNCINRPKQKNKGTFEESYTIDSVFTPKFNISGEIDDEAEREVEAFKRFCYDHPRPSGQKPKVNLNVNDIFSKKQNFK